MSRRQTKAREDAERAWDRTRSQASRLDKVRLGLGDELMTQVARNLERLIEDSVSPESRVPSPKFQVS